MPEAAVPTPPGGGPRSGGVIGWFVDNRVAANLLLFGIALGGLLTIGGVPQELLPETPPSTVTIRTAFPGAGAETIEANVLAAMEERLRDTEGIREISGTARPGIGVLTVELEHWADFQTVSDEVRERIESIENLPQDAEEPVITEAAARRLLLRVAIHGDADERALTEAAHLVREGLAGVSGVAAVVIASGRDYEIAVEVSGRLLTRFGLTLDQVAAAIRRGSADIAAGSVRTPDREVRLRTEAQAADAAAFARIPLVAAEDGGVVTVGDVATVTDGFADVQRVARMNGEPAIFLEVMLAPGARLLDTVTAVQAEVGELAAALPPGLSLTSWADAWRLFESRMDVLVRNGLQGLALIFLVLFFTLSTRVAVWTAAGLPVAFFGAFLMMPGLGVTVNMLSMFGFIVTLGIVVDDAIVVGENVQRHITGQPGGAGEAAVRGVRQVLFPASFGVLSTMAAFAPLLGLPGVWGELAGTLPRIVIPVLAFSLLDAAWILPHHLAHGGLGVRPSRRLARIRERVQAALDGTVAVLYRPALRWCVDNPAAAVALGVVSLALSLGLIRGRWIPVEPALPFDTDAVRVQVSLPPGATAATTLEIVEEIEAAIGRVRSEFQSEHGVDPQKNLAVLVGQRFPLGARGGEDSARPTIGQLIWELAPAEERAEVAPRRIADRLRALLGSLPHGGEATVFTSAIGDGSDVAVRIRGDRPEDIAAGSLALQALLRESPGVIAVSDDLESPAPELVARVRPGGTATGVGAADLGRQLRQAFHGEEIQRIQRGNDEIRVILRYPEPERRSLDAVAGMRVRRGDGRVTAIGEVADISSERGPAVIQWVDGQRAVTVQATVDPGVASPGALVTGVRDRMLPEVRERFPGLGFEVVGAAGDQQETMTALRRNLLLGLILIYMLLAIPLSSWLQPFVIMAAVPFGLAGAVFGHAVVGLPLSLTSFIGMVPLTGIVVNDSLVLLDFINRRRREGMSVRDAALAAGPLRFRPVILTSVTTCGGLAPLMIERSVQAQVLIPMAVSLSFGVAFATLVTLLLVPALYRLAPGR